MCGYFCIGFIDFILAGKTLIDFTTLFFLYDFEKRDNIIWVILKMSECNSIRSVNISGLNNQTKFRLNEINEIKDCFNSEIPERKITRKNQVNTLLLLII